MSTEFLYDKIAIITGASSGIGRATSLALAKAGARVVLVARRAEALHELAAEIQRTGREALALSADVTRREQIDAVVQAVVSRWGGVDILVANAGEYIRGPIVETEPEELQRSFDINYFGSVYCIKAVLPHMLARRSGHIVAVTSMDGKIGLPPDAPYVSAKFALTGFLEVLRQEVRDHGVAVTNVLPGRVDTVMIQHLRFSWISPKISPESVARAILHALRTRIPIVILPPRAKLLYFVNVLAPRLSDRLTRLFRLEGWSDSGGQ